MGKEKTQEHSLETEAGGALAIVLSDWIINPHDQDDYGIDFSVRPVIGREQLPIEIDIQLKSSESYDGETEISQRLDTDALEDYMRSRKPVFLMAYEKESGEIYWTLIQEYIWEQYGKDPENWQNQSSVTIKLERQPLSDSRDALIEVAENAEKPIYQYVLEEKVMSFMLERASRSQVQRALRKGESESIAFRESTYTADIAETATGMANANGGSIVFGLEEQQYSQERALVGVGNPDEMISLVEKQLGKIEPQVDFETTIENIDGENMVIVEIDSHSQLPHSIDGKFIIRENTTNRPLSAKELKDYFI